MKKAVLTILLILTLGCELTPAQTLSEARARSVGGKYVEPRKDELATAEKLFVLIFSPNRKLTEVSDLARKIGLEVVPVRERSEELLIARELENEKRGRGMYVFRTNNASQQVVEAPHSSDDAHTGLLAELLFLESRAAAAAWNTVPRDQSIEGGKGEADLAHLSESYFVAFTRAFASACPGGVLIQLHGFAPSERKSEAGARSDAILSSGTESPPGWITKTAERLKADCGGRFSVYPTDVRELGATTNSQMKALKSVKHSGFLHVETCLDLRKRLKSNTELRKAFWRSLPEKQP